MKYKYTSLFAFLALSSFWIGCYFLNNMEKSHWAHFPTFATLVIFVLFFSFLSSINLDKEK